MQRQQNPFDIPSMGPENFMVDFNGKLVGIYIYIPVTWRSYDISLYWFIGKQITKALLGFGNCSDEFLTSIQKGWQGKV